uniref:MAGE domain-containing protein n=1 Tax=Marmota marmota marmota TaxID=9994 RepID=A0A8C5Z9F5_MARMA
MSIDVVVSLQYPDFKFFSYIPRSRITWLNGVTIPSFLRNHHTALQSTGAQERMPGSSQAAASPESSRSDPLTRKASLLVQILLEKYETKEPITQADMLKVVNKKYKEYFPEILRRTSEHVELVFGLELKEVDPNSHSYILISKLGGFPKTYLLMRLLGVIFMKGNRATEAQIWEFLNVFGIYAGRKHLIFGEPRKLITKDLVDPPSFEFLWGLRAHAETSKMKVLEVLAKINDTNPNAFPNLYEEALRDEEEKTGEKAMGRVGAPARARAVSKTLPHRPSHINLGLRSSVHLCLKSS